MKPYQKSFYIKTPCGNNAFSFSKRGCQEIQVASLQSITHVPVLRPSRFPVFVEMDEEEIEQRCLGLLNFYGFQSPAPTFIFDNHNHAFYWIYQAVVENILPAGLPLLHIDQHKDTRQPSLSFQEIHPQIAHKTLKKVFEGFEFPQDPTEQGLWQAFYYTNWHLHVGCYLPPLVQAGLIGAIYQVNSFDALTSICNQSLLLARPYILDIDLDYFAMDLNETQQQQSLQNIRFLLQGASFVSVATSPYFLPFEEALKWFEALFY